MIILRRHARMLVRSISIGPPLQNQAPGADTVVMVYFEKVELVMVLFRKCGACLPSDDRPELASRNDLEGARGRFTTRVDTMQSYLRRKQSKLYSSILLYAFNSNTSLRCLWDFCFRSAARQAMLARRVPANPHLPSPFPTPSAPAAHRAARCPHLKHKARPLGGASSAWRQVAGDSAPRSR